MAGDIHQVLHELERSGNSIPETQIREVIARWDESAPKLLRLCEDAVRNPEAFADAGKKRLHRYALYLFAHFRDKRVYPLFISSFSLSGCLADELFSDFIPLDEGRLLASVYNGNPAPLHGLIENAGLGDFQRSSGLRALKTLYLAGEIDKAGLVKYFRLLFRGRLERKGSLVWDTLISVCADLGFAELREDIKKAYDEGVANPMYSGLPRTLSELERNHGAALSGLRDLRENRGGSLIGNILDEMSGWPCFSKETGETPVDGAYKPVDIDMNLENEDSSRFAEPVRILPLPGRNAPCSCGSGKKNKNCCGKDRRSFWRYNNNRYAGAISKANVLMTDRRKTFRKPGRGDKWRPLKSLVSKILKHWLVPSVAALLLWAGLFIYVYVICVVIY